MNLSETARLLGAMASFDRRTVGDGDVIAWQAVLPDAAFEDCLEAVKQHYAEQTEWMMPAHVRRAVRGMVSQREAAARATGWAPGQYGTPRDEAVPEVASGERLALSDLPAAVADLVARVRADLPEGSREALYPRRAAWEREHAAYLRTRDAKPNPLYRPDAAPYPLQFYCHLCSATSQDLPAHMADYHPEACSVHGPDCTCGNNNMSGGHADGCPRASW